MTEIYYTKSLSLLYKLFLWVVRGMWGLGLTKFGTFFPVPMKKVIFYLLILFSRATDILLLKQ